jgi:hypothetical protein
VLLRAVFFYSSLPVNPEVDLRPTQGEKQLPKRACEASLIFDEGLPVPEISRRISGLDKSNRRRAIQGLMVRGVVEEKVEDRIVGG